MQKPSKLTNKQIEKIAVEINSNIRSWIENSQLPKYSGQWFLHACDEACKSNFKSAKVGCVIVYKNHIIGKGHNHIKTDPYQKKYNERYKNWEECKCGKPIVHSLHAEISALKSIPYTVVQKVDWKKVEVYVCRVAPGLASYSGLALPCISCAHALRDFGVTKVYYSTGREDKPFGCCDL